MNLFQGHKAFAAVFSMLVILTMAILNSCSAVVGVGATVGVAAAQERGVKGRAKDLKIETMLLKKFIDAGLKLTTVIGAEVYDGRVLLTGATKDTTVADRAVSLAWQTPGVKAVINEIQVGGNSTIRDIALDSWITTQLKSKITMDNKILAINYVVETVNRVVYLIGTAQNRSELERVLFHANGTGRVKRIINHVRFKKKSYEPS